MSRISKVEMAKRKETEVRAAKARESILAQFGKLLDKHLANMLRPNQEASGNLRIMMNGDGDCSLSLAYVMEVRDGASFPMDDGQEEISLSGPISEHGGPA